MITALCFSYSTGIYDISLLSCLFTWFQIFHTPEGMLSTEQGVYIAESVTAKNTKQAKGRFRMYDDENGLVHLIFFYSLCYISQ